MQFRCFSFSIEISPSYLHTHDQVSLYLYYMFLEMKWKIISILTSYFQLFTVDFEFNTFLVTLCEISLFYFSFKIFIWLKTLPVPYGECMQSPTGGKWFFLFELFSWKFIVRTLLQSMCNSSGG